MIPPFDSPPIATDSRSTAELPERHASGIVPMMVAAPGHYDELRGRSFGVLSGFDLSDPDLLALVPHWQQFFSYPGSQNAGVLERKAAYLRNKLQENGVSYNVYADPNNPQSPWSLNLFPSLITSAEWQTIEGGVLQRTRLLEKIMGDVYGPQTLLQKALLPAALVQGHPGYMRAMVGAQPSGGRHLHIAAFDLAKDPQGQWCLIAQRTQAPSGLGYLLENRDLISRLFPDAFTDLGVRTLMAPYHQLVAELRRTSAAGEQAHIALLTPGPYSETYFEHAYLARHLGLTLVEGADLVVRDQTLYLKTLGGLERIHGLVKRLDDDFLDPLELRADSRLGVPGLLQAIRAGHVVMANAPGSAFLESPALHSFMPPLAQALLGEDLLIPALPTWWCGEKAALDEALPQLNSGVIKASYPGYAHAQGAFDAVMGQNLSAAQLSDWTTQVLRNRNAFTLQSYLAKSQVPTWSGRHIEPHSATLRVFVLSSGPGQWQVLPGGMLRIAQGTSEITSLTRGGSSADVWVQAGAPVTTGHVTSSAATIGQATSPASPSTTSPTPGEPSPDPAKRLITSRAAENLFWLGRYSERMEWALGVCELILQSIDNQLRLPAALAEWLNELAVRMGLVGPDTPSLDQAPQEFEQALISGLHNTKTSLSAGYNLQALKQSAFYLRERLSLAQWNFIVETEAHFFDACRANAALSRREALNALAHNRIAMNAITGLQTDRMARDDGWRLLSIGRLVERLLHLSDALLTGLDTRALQFAPEGSSLCAPGAWDTLLELFDSTIPFRATHHNRQDLPALLACLVQDRDNPRALAWVCRTLRGRLAKLADDENLVQDATTLNLPHLDTQDTGPWRVLDAQGRPNALAQTLQQCSQAAHAIAAAVDARYLSHARNGAHTIGF